MTYSAIRNMSYSFSFIFHVLLLLIFLLITFNLDYPPHEYVELSFGNSSESGSSGSPGNLIEQVTAASSSEEKNQTIDKSLIVKEVKLPKAENTEEQNIIKPAEKDKEISSTTTSQDEQQSSSNVSSEAQGNNTEGEGGFGFDIDWGGKGKRQIWSFPLPKYPAGVYKEIDIKIMFTIKPDGSVGSTKLLTKADTKLENAALNSLRQWRFEPLSSSYKQIEQTVVIVFPYRLQ
jgi:outer membrane biosynthesis protein TonB